MISLKEKSGLNIFLKKDGELKFGEDILKGTLQPRFLEEGRFYFKNNLKNFNPHQILYNVYRGVSRKRDKELFKKENLRYDLTVIFPGNVGQEFNKTAGHFHPFKSGTKCSYPEIIEVIYGKLVFLLQKFDLNLKKVVQVFYIEAKEGEKFIGPWQPGFLYGYSSINVTNDFLVISNISESNFKSDYSQYKEKRGASFYIIKKNGKIKIIRNYNYKEKPKLIKIKPKENKKLGLDFKTPLYQLFIEKPKIFEYLKNPESFSP